jgi:dTMP kinase
MGHQGGKIMDEQERQKFFNWLYDLEYKIFAIPQPDTNIILHVSAEIGQKLVDQKGQREYVGGQKRDIHEADINHLKMAEKVYLQIANIFPNFELIECVKDGAIMTREEIHEKVLKAVLNTINQ